MIPDEKLRLALDEYDAAIMAALPDPSDCDHQFSKRFERKMRGVCRMAKHPVAYKTLQRAACILLALLALFGSVIAFNPDVQAAVTDWVTKYFGRSANYSYTEEPDSTVAEQKSYALGWLPEGYEFYKFMSDPASESIGYANETGQILCFSYHYATPSELFIIMEEHTKKTASVNGQTADVYLSHDPEVGSCILWKDPETHTLFYISAAVSEEDLMRLALSVTEKN